jgi:hypothetical protein
VNLSPQSGPIVTTHGSPGVKRYTVQINKLDITPAQYKIRALYRVTPKCTRYVQATWFYSSPEEHFRQISQPTQLENWLTVNKARIISHITHQQNHTTQGQRTITDFLSRSTLENEASREAITVTPPTVSRTNAPLTREPGGSAGDELRAHR